MPDSQNTSDIKTQNTKTPTYPFPYANLNGRFRKSPEVKKNEKKGLLENLKALAYLQGSKVATNSSKITVYDKQKSLNGLNFFTSGHKPAAYLMDM